MITINFEPSNFTNDADSNVVFWAVKDAKAMGYTVRVRKGRTDKTFQKQKKRRRVDYCCLSWWSNTSRSGSGSGNDRPHATRPEPMSEHNSSMNHPVHAWQNR